ncbi:VanW family protein [Demequina sp. NBRC 110053]|uniref:VanW family protein n=1 Tax=Demequina sp. NBRC 110053 TaxID=1570342 RepID=UPI0011869DF4|nr:VanW family protein [Demequina sp. NBRC 110053]
MEERVPTSELRTPAWLTEAPADALDPQEPDEQAAGEDPDDVPEWAKEDGSPYTPTYDPAPRPGDPDYVDDDDPDAAGPDPNTVADEAAEADADGEPGRGAGDAGPSVPSVADAEETAVLEPVVLEPVGPDSAEGPDDDAPLADTAVLPPVGDEAGDAEAADAEPAEAEVDERPVVARSSVLGGAAAGAASASQPTADASSSEVAGEAPPSAEANAETSTAAPWADAAAPAASPPASPDRSEHGAAASDATGARETGDHAARPRRKGRWAIVPLAIVALGVLYVGAQALLSGTVPRETESLGVSIGGMSAAEATGALGDLGDAVASEDLVLETSGLSYTTTAAAAGLAVDADATVDQVTGFTLAPQRLWMHVSGGGHIEPVVTVDQEALDATVAEAAQEVDGPGVDASVSIEGESVEVIPGRPAVEVDQAASAQLVAAAWPGFRTVALVADVMEPDITDADAESFAQTIDQQYLAGPVTLVGDDVETTVEPATVASHATVVTGPNGLELEIDGAALAAQMVADDPELATEGESASVTFDDDHEIVIDEGRPGITIDGDALADVIVAAASAPDRSGELPYTAAEAEVSPEDLGIPDLKEVVASFNTPLTADRVRTQNLRTAAADVQGTVLLPGDEFNLYEVLSPITAEEGYGDAPVIVDGVLTAGLGGGLSQMATTTYNAAYFAGFELLQHRPHSVWFARYPAGRESTLWGSTINVRFVNNTPYAAVINSYTDGGSLHVDVWSTPHFEVETSASPKTNVTQPGTKEVRSANCEAKGPGQPGFTITNTRVVTLDGEEVDRNVDTWTYQPDDAIRCVSEDEQDDDSDDS